MTVPTAAPAYTYALECLICGTTPDQVPNLHHGSNLNNLQAHMTHDHGFTWDDWQAPDRIAKTETRRADGAMIYVWTRVTDDLPFMRAAQIAAPSGDTFYLDIASPSQACWDWRTNLVHLTDPAQGNSVTHCGLAVNGIDLPWFSRTQPYLAASDMCGACHDLAIGRQLARAVFARIDASLAEAALHLAQAGSQPLSAIRYAHALRRRLDGFTLVQEHGRRAHVALALGPDGARVVVAFPTAASRQRRRACAAAAAHQPGDAALDLHRSRRARLEPPRGSRAYPLGRRRGRAGCRGHHRIGCCLSLILFCVYGRNRMSITIRSGRTPSVRDRASATLFALSGLLLLTVLIAQPPSALTQLAAAAATAAAGIPIRYGVRRWPIILAASLVALALALGASGVTLFV